jgi:hypothetical protein
MKRLLTLGIVTVALTLTLHASRGAAADPGVTRNYRLDFKGNAGVKVRLLLVTKATSNANPERREEVVTLPAQIDFKAVRCYAWIDTLPNGESGNEGDTCSVDLLKDGSTSAGVEWKIKKQNNQSGGMGDL